MSQRTCTRCGVFGGLETFYKDVRCKGGLKAHCKQCVLARMSEYGKQNVEKLSATRMARYYADHEASKAKKREDTRRRKDEIRELRRAGRERNREARKAAMAAWQKANKAKVAAISKNYQAAKLKRTPPWADRAEMLKVYERAAALGWHVDHEIPLQGKLVSGLHVQGNLRVLPPAENIRKSNHFEPF